MAFILKSRLRPAIRQLLQQRQQELADELAQIEALLEEDEAHTLVGMPEFAVHGGPRLRVLRHKRRPSPEPRH